MLISRVASSALALCLLTTASERALAALKVPKGTTIMVRTAQSIDSKRQSAGTKFTVVVEANAMVGSQVAIPAGSRAYGTIVTADKSGRLVGKSEMTIALTQISLGGTLVPVQTSGVKASGEGKGKKTVGKAAVGAAIGAVFGGGKGAAQGAAIGGAAALLTQGDQVQIPANTLLDFTLGQDLSVPGGPSAPPAPKAAAPQSDDPTSVAIAAVKVQNDLDGALQRHNWKQRTEFKDHGKSKMVRMELIRFRDGAIQRTKMSEDPRLPASYASVVDQMHQLRRYGVPSAGTLLDFLQSAKLISSGDEWVAEGTDVLEQGDNLKVTLDKKTNAIVAVHFSTKLGADAVEGQVRYRRPSTGLAAPEAANITFPKKGYVIDVEAFSFEKD
jgi:hypothetical protein